jgi:ubiquinone/menaquinone biosynthesis C-methylase UbiE
MGADGHFVAVGCQFDHALTVATNVSEPTAAERAGLRFESVEAFDGAAMATFFDPEDGGVDPGQLAIAASTCTSALCERIARSLPPDARRRFLRGVGASPPSHAVEAARRQVLEQLFWPLVYWTRPDDYAELVSGERINARVVEELDLDDKNVCDIGAGAGRFSLIAAPRAHRVVAVDAVPALLRRLKAAARRARITNIEVCRAAFRALPLRDHTVDLAVACSSFTTSGPHGGLRALREAERIVRPGGAVAVLWPQHPHWFRERGYEHVVVRGQGALCFRDVETAQRLCALYYSDAAARWVRDHAVREVPYSVLGVPPPNDICIRRIP